MNVTARVLDIAANYDGQTISNSATLTYTNPNTGLPNDVTDSPVLITVREPRISVNKTLAGSGARQIGNTLDYTVDVTSDGSTTVYEWELRDTLPTHTTLTSTPVCTNGGSSVTISHSVSAGVLTITPNPLAGSTLPVGETVSCSYELTIGVSAVAGTTYPNTADVDWRNATSASGFSRYYNDSVSIPFDGTQDTDTASYAMEAIGISKSDGGATTAAIGQTINYTLTVNAPNAVLDDFTVEDTLPAGMIFNNDANIVGTGSVVPTVSAPNNGSAPVTVLWDFGSVSHDGTTITITYSARVANVVGNANDDVLTNTVELSFTPELGTPQVVTDTESFEITEPELEIAKTVSNPSSRFGSTQSYTLDIAHAVASDIHAHDVVVTDTLPTGLSYVTGSVVLPVGWSLSVSGQILTFSASTLNYGGLAQITYDTLVDSPPTSIQINDSLTNTALATWTSLSGTVSGERTGAGGVDRYSVSDTSAFTVTGIDLLINKSTVSSALLPGDTVVYELDYANDGNATATSVVITETVPDNTVFNATASAVGWSCADESPAGTVCEYSAGTMTPASTGNILFAVDVLPVEDIERTATDIENTTSITSAVSDGPDADIADNEDSIVTPLTVADVQITKTDTVDPVFLTHDYSYVLTITNNGPSTATNITLEDSLPAGVSYRAYSATGATCTFVDPLFSCTLATLANGASEIITVDVTGDTPGNKLNTANITHDQQDPDLLNNTDTENTFVDPADLALTKTADKTTATVGDIVTFTITVRNNGPDTATNVVITDAMPSIFELQSSTLTQGVCSGTSTITCPIGTLTNGQTATITLKTKVIGVGKATNTVSSTLNEYDPDPSNNTAVGVEVLGVAKTVNNLASTGVNILFILLSGQLIVGATYFLYRRTKVRT